MKKTDTSPALHWRVHGETGTPVLLIMGFTMRGRVWAPQLKTLPDHHRVLTFDHRGLGDSETTHDWWSMADMAADALRVLDHAGFGSAHIVGVSMGGMISQELALAAPDRVRSLTLIATHGGGPFTSLPRLRGALALAQATSKDTDRRARALERALYPKDFVQSQDPEAFRAALAERLTYRPPIATARRQLRAVLGHRALHRLHAVTAPTLVVRPDRDNLIHPRNSDRLHAALPNAELLTYADAGHGLIHQEADDLNARLLAHFARADRAADGGSGPVDCARGG